MSGDCEQEIHKHIKETGNFGPPLWNPKYTTGYYK